MTAERWNRIAEIYDSVADAPLSARGLLLDEACGNDEGLRREIESLLEAREEAGDFLSPGDLHQHILELSGSDVMADPVDMIGRYKMLSVIGAGGMGDVYLAHDAELNRRVALKILPVRFARDAVRIARFRREARAASALSHPNIVTIYDVGQTGHTWFIATEFIEGITLRQRLEEGLIEVKTALEIALQCAAALQAAHAASILHRDVKPENILLRPDGVVKIVDFGLARSVEDRFEALDGATQSGAVLGTPRYMSPEQARAQRLDTRTDIFSLGAVTYEMIAGRPAFPGDTPAEIFASLLDSDPEPLSPPALNAIVQKSLSKDRDARYKTVLDFATDLRRFQDQPVSFPSRAGQRKSARVSRRAVVTGAAGALVAGVGLYQLRPRPPRATVRDSMPTNATPLTSFTGLKDFGSFSPEEDRVAFSWNGGQGGSGGKRERNIYVKTLESSDPVRLTNAPQDETHPVWSPDGRSIAFCRTLDDRTPYMRFAIYNVPALGGSEHRLAEGGEGVSWSPDGKSLALAGLPPESGGIFRFSLDTNRQTRLTRSPGNLDQLPVFSPDGKWIVFTRSLGPRARELFVVPAAGGPERQITFDHQPTYGAAWTADSRDIVFSSNRAGGGESLWRISLAGGVPQRVAGTLGGAFYPSISKKGTRLVYTESFEDTNIYLSEGEGFAGRSTPGRFSPPSPLIVSSRRDDSPNISPAGDRIAFVSRRTGNEEIWVCNRDGSHPIELTSFRGPATGTPRWSPDGRWLAFDSIASGNPDIFIIDAAGGSPQRVTRGPFPSYMPSWSVDGLRIYFKSDRSGSDQIWSIPITGGVATQITRGGGIEAFAAPDGKNLYYTQRSWGTIWSVPLDGGAERPVPELQDHGQIFRSWGVVRQGIYFMSRERTRTQTVYFFSFATRQVAPILTLETEPIWSYPSVALSFDGRRLLTVRLEQEVNDLMVIENFR